jgi:hypothetical protein
VIAVKLRAGVLGAEPIAVAPPGMNTAKLGNGSKAIVLNDDRKDNMCGRLVIVEKRKGMLIRLEAASEVQELLKDWNRRH